MTAESLLVAILVKPAVVVACALAAAGAARRSSAATRHAIWTGAVAAVLILPLLAALLPPLRLGAVVAPIASLLPSPPPVVAGAQATASPSSQSESLRTTLTPIAQRDASSRIGDPVFLVWLAVALLLVLRRLGSELQVRRLVARSRSASPRLTSRCAAIARAAGIAHDVSLRISDQTSSPAVAGVLRPVVLLPVSAESWTDAETDAVLHHELSHVVRRDCAINLAADVAAAIHWCNPLVHLAVRRLRAEGERACDDRVLQTGNSPDAYALLLLGFARAANEARTLPRAVTAMARPSELETRLMAVLDLRLSRAPLRGSVVAVLATLTALLAVPIASATLRAAPAETVIPSEAAVIPSEARDLQFTSSRIQTTEPDLLDDSLASPRSELLPLTLDDESVTRAGRTLLAGPDSALASVLLAALSRVPQHENDFVRDRSAWALSQARDGRLVEPLIRQLDARDWRVQAYAAWALAVSGDRRAVPTLIPLASHPVWRLRAMAASALSQLGDRRADAVMTSALLDPAWQVRMEAVEYLANVGDAASMELVRARLADRHVAVRRAATRALDSR